MLKRNFDVKTLLLRKVSNLSSDLILGNIRLSNCMVFFDFDNTITNFDVLDGIIEQFSINRDWVAFEDAWKAGDIGSKECLAGQLRTVRANKDTISDYLSTIVIDAHFKKLLSLLYENGIYPIILSDSFYYFIKYILDKNDIKSLPIFANRMRFYGDRLIPVFPYTNGLCSRCAHCKTNSLSNLMVKDKQILYIGDGLSDVCPANNSDIVFAKSTLLNHFRKINRPCLAFTDLGDIYNYFEKYIYASKSKEISEALKAAQR